MDKRKFLLIPYVKHLLNSRSGFKIHSPFVYKFYKNILEDSAQYPDYKTIDAIRKKLLNSSGTVAQVPIPKLIRRSSIKTSEGQLLLRIVRYFRPRTILELGTSLGISTLYMALGSPGANIITIEGNKETFDFAGRNFSELGIMNIHPIHGNFDDILTPVLTETGKLDLVFFDGNHKKEPTLRYFNLCLEHMNRDSLFIFHDIHWSEGMEQAWKEIRSHPSVTVSIDLFHMGMVFFDDRLSKEDFILNLG